MPEFDPTDPAFLQDPYPTYAWLREQAPIFYFEPWDAWVLTRYRDVSALLRDRRLGRVLENLDADTLARHVSEREAAFEISRVGSLLEIEPPDHTRVKGVFHETFTPRRVRELGPKITALCERLADVLLSRPEHRAELITDFAQIIPVTVIADLLGIPEADREKLVPWSKGIIGWFEPERTPEMEEEAIRCAQAFMAYLKDLIPRRRADPGDDLLSAMIYVHDHEPERLSELELINNCILLLNAGHEAVVNVIGNGMRALLSHPEAWWLLQEEPQLIPRAVEEMMRFDTPLQFFERRVRTPMTYEEFTWPRGTKLVLYYASANRDPEVFAAPDTFDVRRDPNPHLAFGLGLHYCIGAPLARLELNVALRVLLTRLPGLRLTGEPLSYQPRNVFRYLEALPVCY